MVFDLQIVLHKNKVACHLIFLSFFVFCLNILYQKTVEKVMNKKTKIFAVVSLVCILLCGFAGCKNLNTTLEDTVSEIHEKVFYASDDNFFAQVVSGKIEKNCALDGVKNEMQNFVMIKIKANEDFENMSAEITLQNKKYNEQLLQSPIDSRLWTVVINDNVMTENIALSVTADESKHEFNMQQVAVGETKPIDLLKQAFEKELMDCFDGKSFLCETTIRLVKSPDEKTDKYFWYVVVYKPDKNFFGLMADCVTGEIVAKKN